MLDQYPLYDDVMMIQLANKIASVGKDITKRANEISGIMHHQLHLAALLLAN